MSDEAKVLSAEEEAKVRRLLDMALEGSFAAEEGRALLAALDAERARADGLALLLANERTLNGSDLTGTACRERAERERDAALKACAEMRKALGPHAETCDSVTILSTEEPCNCGVAKAYYDAMRSNAGKGYASPDEQRALVEKAWDMGFEDGCRGGRGLPPMQQRALDLAALKEGR